MLYIQTEYVNIGAGWLTGKNDRGAFIKCFDIFSALPIYISCTYEQNIKEYVCTESEETARRLVFLKK